MLWIGDFPHQHEELLVPVENDKFYLLAYADNLPKHQRYLVPKYTEKEKIKLYEVATNK